MKQNDLKRFILWSSKSFGLDLLQGFLDAPPTAEVSHFPLHWKWNRVVYLVLLISPQLCSLLLHSPREHLNWLLQLSSAWTVNRDLHSGESFVIIKNAISMKWCWRNCSRTRQIWECHMPNWVLVLISYLEYGFIFHFRSSRPTSASTPFFTEDRFADFVILHRSTAVWERLSTYSRTTISIAMTDSIQQTRRLGHVGQAALSLGRQALTTTNLRESTFLLLELLHQSAQDDDHNASVPYGGLWRRRQSIRHAAVLVSVFWLAV